MWPESPPCAGNMADASGSTKPCRATGRPVAVLIMHGSDDRNVPVEGGASPDYPDQLPTPRSATWSADGAREPVHPDRAVRQEGNVTIRRWDGDAPVELHLVIGGGHEWYPGAARRSRISSPRTRGGAARGSPCESSTSDRPDRSWRVADASSAASWLPWRRTAARSVEFFGTKAQAQRRGERSTGIPSTGWLSHG